MDHIRLTFLQYLWGMCFVIPNTIILFMKGISLMLFRRWMKRRLGIDTTVKYSPDAIVAEVVLETMLVTYFRDRDSDDIGCFVWHSLPAMTNSDELESFDVLTLFIDLKTRRFLRAEYVKNGQSGSISSQDTLVLLFWNLVGNVHVKIHSVANWGIDPTAPNELVRQYSVCSTLYNFIGFSRFVPFCKLLHRLGLIESPCQTFLTAINIGINSGMHEHVKGLHHIGTHSKLAFFIFCARRKFLKLLPKYKKDFGTVIAEALFVGTVIHSLDHSQMEYVVPDALCFEARDSYYQAMATQCRVVRAAFVQDLPFITWDIKCRDSRHPFFRQLYENVRYIDLRLASCMDCCIAK